ncbi:RpiR family transcriptional regulator [Aliiruegeria haliotis]|uniref:RpiR family transcriptional regulator n=1 Tax=Aliiruegeria haliotis TaxID=1280846 RepID=A0A2T0RIF3_9RHOB|nr:MurR/RpiR family transcriptional regulator [Aliiruegeria haliotis]PRY20963.1 RpiR family transcriptional regulator [Aliiruegeria haliotis]
MDPTLKTKTISRLKEGLEGFTPRMRTVAKYILDNPAEFGLDTVRQTAQKAGVSTYTLVRTARQLGFESYDALRDPFRHALVSSAEFVDLPGWLAELPDTGDTGRIQAEAALNSLAIVQRSLERQSPDTLDRVAEVLFSARKAFVTGTRASYAMAYYFHYVGRMALPSLDLIPRHVGSAVDELNEAGEGDVLVAIMTTPYSRETVDTCRFAQSRGVALILVSDSEISFPDLRPEISMPVSAISTHHFACYSGIAAVLEGVLSVLLHRGGEETAERIKSYEAVRKAHAAYWKPKKN